MSYGSGNGKWWKVDGTHGSSRGKHQTTNHHFGCLIYYHRVWFIGDGCWCWIHNQGHQAPEKWFALSAKTLWFVWVHPDPTSFVGCRWVCPRDESLELIMVLPGHLWTPTAAPNFQILSGHVPWNKPKKNVTVFYVPWHRTPWYVHISPVKSSSLFLNHVNSQFQPTSSSSLHPLNPLPAESPIHPPEESYIPTRIHPPYLTHLLGI